MATHKKRRVRGEVYQRIQRLVDADWTPAQIHKTLGDDPRSHGYDTGDVPTLRSIQRIVRDLAPKDATGSWTVASAEPEEISDVLDVIAEITVRSEGRVKDVTERTASWIARLRRAVPTLRPVLVFELAKDYMRREDNSEDTEDLDFYLAFASRSERAPEPDKSAIAEQHAEQHARLYPERLYRPIADDVGIVARWASALGAGAGYREMADNLVREYPPGALLESIFFRNMAAVGPWMLRPQRKSTASKRTSKKGATR